jgi:hypothetical protein
MRLDLIGSVEQLRLTAANSLYPVFEAVSNSIHSIRDACIENGLIRIELIRDSQQPSFDVRSPRDSDLRGIGELVEIRISDNGIGFSDENFSAFEEIYTRRKAKIGGKGVGRLSWLKVFRSARVESTYRTGTEWRHRSFLFVLPGGVEESVDASLQPDAAKVLSTTITLLNPLPEFQEALRRRTSTIRDAIERHFLAELLSPSPPQIQILDGDETLIVALEGITGRHSGEFKLKDRQFKIEHLRVKSPERRQHSVHFCADRRSVKHEQIRTLPDVRFQDDGGEFYYYAYVSSPYLDAYVDQQRTGFAIQDDSDLVPGLSFNEIRDGVGETAAAYLEPHLSKLNREKQARVSRVIDEVFPERAYLREQNSVDLDRISVIASEKDIRDEIARIHSNNLKTGRELLASIVEDMKNVSTVDLSAFAAKFASQLEEIARPTQADLASYMLFRRSIIDVYRELLRKTQGRFEKEAAIHNLIFPMGKEHQTDKGLTSNNLWLLDERLTYADYIASDRPLNQHKVLFEVTDRDEPDVVCYFNLGFSTEDPAEGRLRTVVLVEFKRPGPVARRVENPAEQVLRYVDKIRAGFFNENGQKIKGDEGTRFYCYIVCDLDNDVIEELVKFRDFTPLFDGSDGYFRYVPPLRAYIELIPFERILSDAERKHRAFFERLGVGSSK